MKLDLRSFLVIGYFISATLLLTCYVIGARSVGAYFTNIADFIFSLPLTYYIGYYLTITLIIIIIYALNWSEKRPALYGLPLLLLFALFIDFPRYIFTYPFQRETFHQAQIFHVLSYGTLSGLPPHRENVANPIFWGVFIEITSLESFLTVLYFAPIFMWLLTILCLFVVVRRLSDNYRAFISTLFFQALFFELLFANRYAYASPLFVLFIGLLVESLMRPSGPLNCLLILLAPTIIIAHVCHSTLALIATTAIACLLAWYKFKEGSVSRYVRTHAWNIALLFFSTYGFWYFVQEMRLHGIEIWFNVFIDVLRKGFFELELVEAVYKLPLEPAYELIVKVRIAIALLVIVLPLVLAVFHILKNIHGKSTYRIIHVGIAVTYILFLVPLGVGVIKGIWSLRPFHILMLFSPILIALLLPRRLLKPFVFIIMLSSIIIVHILWIPNLGYIQVPNEKVALVKFASAYIPQRQTVGAIGTGWIEQTLLTHVFSNRTDLKISSIGDVLSRNWEYVETSNIRYVIVDPSIEKYEVKYVCEPEIRERVQHLSSTLMEDHYFNKVYDIGSLYILLYK